MNIQSLSSDAPPQNLSHISQARTEKGSPQLFQKQEVQKEHLKKEEKPQVQDPEKLRELAEKINSHINLINRKVQFKVDYHSDQTLIEVIDVEHDKVIRQIPPEYLVRLEQTLAELTGVITDKTV